MRAIFCYHKWVNAEWIDLYMSTMRFSHLRQLATFAIVVETGSFAAAARRIDTSRSRVSEQITALEADLGTRLLQRSTRQLKLTSEGAEVYEQARRLPDILNQVEAVAHTAVPSGRVAITMNHDIAHKYVLPVLDRFQALYPEVKLDLMLDDSPVDLISEQIDLGIRIGFPKDDTLIARMLHEESFALFASPEYLARQGTPSTLEALEAHRWVTLLQTSHDGSLRMRQNDELVEIKARDYYRCNSPLLAQQMIAQGLGIGALLPTTVKDELAKGALVPVMPSLQSDPLVFSLVYPSRRQVPPRTKAVIEYLLAARIFD